MKKQTLGKWLIVNVIALAIMVIFEDSMMTSTYDTFSGVVGLSMIVSMLWGGIVLSKLEN